MPAALPSPQKRTDPSIIVYIYQKVSSSLAKLFNLLSW